MKSNVIFSADDYGPIPAINNGIIEAVKNGCINSVETFSNHNNFEKTTNLLLNECQNNTFELGCHLTITSGKPLTKMNGLFKRTFSIGRNGYFRKYTDLRRPLNQDKRKNQFKILKEELHAQIYQFEKYGFKDHLTHISCHHNVLFFFEDYLNAYFEVANEKGLAVRSPHGKPFNRHKNFIQVVVALSIRNLSLKDRHDMIQFAKTIPELVDKTNNPPPPQRPAYHVNSNYGPISLIKLDEDDIEEHAEDKYKMLVNDLEKYKNSGITEYVFHLITDDFSKQEEFRNQTNFSKSGYTGIDNTYFDSRMAEMRSLIKYKSAIDALIIKESWKNV